MDTTAAFWTTAVKQSNDADHLPKKAARMMAALGWLLWAQVTKRPALCGRCVQTTQRYKGHCNKVKLSHHVTCFISKALKHLEKFFNYKWTKTILFGQVWQNSVHCYLLCQQMPFFRADGPSSGYHRNSLLAQLSVQKCGNRCYFQCFL